MKTFIFLFSLAGFSTALATEMAHFSQNTSILSTRDHFSLREYAFKWMNHRRYPGWDYRGEEKSGFDYGIESIIRNGSAGTSQYKGAQINAIVGMKWNESSSTYLHVGAHQLDNKSKSQSQVTAHLGWNITNLLESGLLLDWPLLPIGTIKNYS